MANPDARILLITVALTAAIIAGVAVAILLAGPVGLLIAVPAGVAAVVLTERSPAVREWVGSDRSG
jgi:predicted PurR-regulated permease PerM